MLLLFERITLVKERQRQREKAVHKPSPRAMTTAVFVQCMMGAMVCMFTRFNSAHCVREHNHSQRAAYVDTEVDTVLDDRKEAYTQ